MLKEKKHYDSLLELFKESNNELGNLKDIYQLAKEETDNEMLIDCNDKINSILKKIKKLKLVVFYLVKMMLWISI